MNPINTEQPQRQIFTVSQLNRRTKLLLETNLAMIWIEGELSNFACPSSGHWYFTLKDGQAQVRCAMFRGRNQLTRLASANNRPKNGDLVLLRCRVSLYEGRGEFQLIAEHMQEAGLGALQRRFEELKIRLSNEGLFEQSHKRALPRAPQHIGVITSPTGAALQDILSVLKRRFPIARVTVYPSAVQGNNAANEIVAAIDKARQHNQCDALILGRGGGSLEDLWPFNEESVARAIYACTLPIVSAIGHEVDFTIADFVADLRAPTPSAAAEILTPDSTKLIALFSSQYNSLTLAATSAIQQRQLRLTSLQQRMRHPGDKLREQAQRLDHLDARLQSALRRKCQSEHTRLSNINGKLNRFHPEVKIRELQLKIDNIDRRISNAIDQQLHDRRQRLGKAVQVLQAVSPLNTISRGYAILQDQDNKLIQQTRQVAAGNKITATLGDGQLLCSVEEVKVRKNSLEFIFDG